jgi:hypothetical protein
MHQLKQIQFLMLELADAAGLAADAEDAATDLIIVEIMKDRTVTTYTDGGADTTVTDSYAFGLEKTSKRTGQG